MGSHVCRGLLEAGWQVTGITRDFSSPHVVRRLVTSLGRLRLISGDAGDPALLEREVPDVNAVFALAGRSGAFASMRDPIADLRANLEPHLALLEALRANNPCARVVFPGSRLQYGPAQELPVNEAHTQRSNSIYGLHKSAVEGYYRLYREQYNLHTTCFRISNAYGPGQARPDKRYGIIGTLLETAASDKTIRLYGGGQQRSDFVYIDDLVELFLLAVSKGQAADGAFNVGGPEPVSLRDAANTIVSVVGRGRVAESPWPPGQAAVEGGDYVSDLNLIQSVFRWRPTTRFLDGLSRTWRSEARNWRLSAAAL